MDTKDGNGYLIKLVSKLLSALLFAGIFLSCSFDDLRQVFLVCAPFAAVFIPGYLEMLPEGGLKHGSSCDCAEADASCEFGLWFEMWQRMALLFPILCSSIFLYYYANLGLERALVGVAEAIQLIGIYTVVYVVAVFALVYLRRL